MKLITEMTGMRLSLLLILISWIVGVTVYVITNDVQADERLKILENQVMDNTQEIKDIDVIRRDVTEIKEDVKKIDIQLDRVENRINTLR